MYGQITVVPTNLSDTSTRSLQIAFPLEFPIGTDWAGRFRNKFLGLFPADGMCVANSTIKCGIGGGFFMSF